MKPASDLDSMRTENEYFIDNINARHTAELQKLESLQNLEFLHQIEELEKENKLKLERVEKESINLIEEAVKKAVNESQRTHEILISDLRREYQEIFNQTAMTEQKNLVLKVEEIKKIYSEHEENSIKSLKLELSNSYLDDIAANNEESKAANQVHLNQIVKTHETDFKIFATAIKTEYENRTSELNLAHAKNLIMKLNENENILSLTHAEHIQKVINEMEEKHEIEIKNIQKEHNEELECKHFEYESQIAEAITTAITNDRDDINAYYEKATTQLKEKTTTALHSLHADLTLKQTTAVAQAVAETEKEYDNRIVILIENNIQNIKIYEEKEKLNDQEFHRQLNDLRTHHELHIRNLLEENSSNKNESVEEALSILQTKHDKIVKKLCLGYEAKLDEINDALVAEQEHSLVKMEEQEIQNDKKLNILLAEQQATLCESHKMQLLQQLKEMRDTILAEHNSIVNELKDKTNNEQSVAIKDIIESYGKKGRDSLEAQRTLFQKERSADLEKTQEEIRVITQNHAIEISNLKSGILKSYQKQLADMKFEMENTTKVTIREREKAAERAMEASSIASYADKELTITNMRSQHVRSKFVCSFCYRFLLFWFI